jgi:hypothetical protein
MSRAVISNVLFQPAQGDLITRKCSLVIGLLLRKGLSNSRSVNAFQTLMRVLR